MLTIASERLFTESRFGQRMQSELRARAEALTSENERLQAELTAEERSLTERRPTMEVDAFRAEAEAFDVRVQAIRNEQDAKQRALEQAIEDSRGAFINAVRPVLTRLMIESGAAVILEQRQVVLSASMIDITDEAIAAIDNSLENGALPGQPQPDAAATEEAPRRAGSPDAASSPGEAQADPAEGEAPAPPGPEAD